MFSVAACVVAHMRLCLCVYCVSVCTMYLSMMTVCIFFYTDTHKCISVHSCVPACCTNTWDWTSARWFDAREWPAAISSTTSSPVIIRWILWSLFWVVWLVDSIVCWVTCHSLRHQLHCWTVWPFHLLSREVLKEDLTKMFSEIPPLWVLGMGNITLITIIWSWTFKIKSKSERVKLMPWV